MNQLNSSFLGNKIHSQISNVFFFYYLSGFSHAESMKLEATTDATYHQREIFQFLFCWILCRPWSNRVLSVSEERRPLSRRNNFRSLSAISLRVVGWSVGRSDTRPSIYLSSLYSALSFPLSDTRLHCRCREGESKGKKRANLLLQHVI